MGADEGTAAADAAGMTAAVTDDVGDEGLNEDEELRRAIEMSMMEAAAGDDDAPQVTQDSHQASHSSDSLEFVHGALATSAGRCL